MDEIENVKDAVKSVADIGKQIQSIFDALLHFYDSVADRSQKKILGRLLDQVSILYQGSELIVVRISGILRRGVETSGDATSDLTWMKKKFEELSPRLENVDKYCQSLTDFPLRQKSEFFKLTSRCRALKGVLDSISELEIKHLEADFNNLKQEIESIMNLWVTLDDRLRNDYPTIADEVR